LNGEMWPALLLTALGVGACVLALASRLKLPGADLMRQRHAAEFRAIATLAVGILLLLVAVVFWIRYLIGTPLSHAPETFNAD
jgi:hypothetical protein